MNTVGVSKNQSASVLGNGSRVNLRGLGTAQTLILVDGHRFGSGTSISGVPRASADLAAKPGSSLLLDPTAVAPP